MRKSPLKTTTTTPAHKENSNPIEHAMEKPTPLPLTPPSPALNSSDFDCDKKDFVLADLVNAANHSSGALAITLFIPGCLVAGEVISAIEFFTLLAEATDSYPNTPPMAGYFAETIQELKTDFANPHECLKMPHYIHLKNARVINGGQSFPEEGGVLWRGRICEVIGFNFGLIVL